LLGAGAVGSQTLLGIPRLEGLRRRIAPRRTLAVWPFETGLVVPSSSIDVVVAEMWPTLFTAELEAEPESDDGPVRDAVQVDAAVRRCLAASERAELESWFAPRVADEDAVVSEEGWILGVT